MKKLSEKKSAIFSFLIGQSITDVQFEKFGGITVTLSNGKKLIGDTDDFKDLSIKSRRRTHRQTIINVLAEFGLKVKRTIVDSSTKTGKKTIKYVLGFDVESAEKKLPKIIAALLEIPEIAPYIGNIRMSKYSKEDSWTMHYAGIRMDEND